jgi:hypothetical protein
MLETSWVKNATNFFFFIKITLLDGDEKDDEKNKIFKWKNGK